tara:strand:+ start:308 stop:676 length:369 start_codon:yes stop_codon:yes gene_type:complete
MDKIDKEELLKSSKWARFIFMVGYAFALNFVVTIFIGLSFIQFLFYLLTSKINYSLAKFNDEIIEFISDTVAFLLFSTDQKPFPFKEDESSSTIVEEVAAEEDKKSEVVKDDESSSEKKEKG